MQQEVATMGTQISQPLPRVETRVLKSFSKNRETGTCTQQQDRNLMKSNPTRIL